MYKNKLKINTDIGIEISSNLKYIEETGLFSNDLDFEKIQGIIMNKKVIKTMQSILESFFLPSLS